MTFIEHTLNWVRGEIFEGGNACSLGAMLVVLAAYFWKFGHSSTAKVLIIPFLVVGLCENKRVDGFIWSHRYLLICWTVMILAGLAIFMLWGGNHGRTIGLGLIIFAIAGLLVDHTSEHNAYSYISLR
jgi:hypothetical protein